MNETEFAKITMALKTFYPRENLLQNKETVALWFDMLGDLPYEIVEIAIKKWVATNKWSPSIAEIRKEAAEIIHGAPKSWEQAWQEVIASIGAYGSRRTAEAMETFDEVTREAVKRMGYRNICMSENPVSERANFREIYKELSERDLVTKATPIMITDQIKLISEKFRLE